MSSSFRISALRFVFLQQIKQTTRLSCLVLFITGSLSSLAQSDTWIQKSDLGYDAVNVPEPTARYGAVSFSIGNKGYLGTGFDGGYRKDFWEYDPAANTWTQKADFGGTARSFAVGFSSSDKGYIGTGLDIDVGVRKDFWEYDPAINSWTQKADFGGEVVYQATGFSIGNKGYIGTGQGGADYRKDFWEFDPSSNKWTRKANFKGIARSGAVGFSIGNKGYIGTGVTIVFHQSNYLRDFWEYDPAADAWTQKTDFGGVGRHQAVGFSVGSKGYIGLANANSYVNDFWEFDPKTNVWTQKKDFGGLARSGAVGFSIGNKGYVGTGKTSYALYQDFSEYDPVKDDWTRKADFAGTARSFAVGFNIGGKGYLGTGNKNTELPLFAKDFWEYNPVINIWTQKADFGGTARHSAVGFNIGNKGYLGTGYDENGVVTNDFWEYDPVANAWTGKADFGGTPRFAAVGFSIGNKGYLGTGNDRSSNKNDFWEYDPTANTWTQKADFRGSARFYAVGLSISDKGYIGTGISNLSRKDFWEYDPKTNIWTQKKDFITTRQYAVGFSIGNKGYIGSGYSYAGGTYRFYKDLWEYDPLADDWMQKIDFGETPRIGAVGFSIGNKGYIGTGTDNLNPSYNRKDFWEYTPDSCPAPYNLRVSKIADTCARLNWNVPDASVEHIKVSYRALGSITWIEDRKKSLENSKVICGLTPNTIYEWKTRNICADDKTPWVKGPNFTTTSSAAFSSDAMTVVDNKVEDNPSVQIIPNPNKGNLTLQMQLPAKAASTTFSLYGSTGEKIWQQAGWLSGSVNISIALESKLAAGVYVLIIHHADKKMIHKVVVMK